jgi:hypothetical protein
MYSFGLNTQNQVSYFYMTSSILFHFTWNPIVHGVVHIQDVVLLEVKQEGLARIRNPDFSEEYVYFFFAQCCESVNISFRSGSAKP